jgi:hypothetical protein
MNDNNAGADDWDIHLHGSETVHPSAELRERILRRTSAVVRRRRWWRHLSRAAALVACYLAGLGTSSLLPDKSAPTPATGAVTWVAGQSVGTPITTSTSSTAAQPGPAERHRQAGNRFAESGDWQAALVASQEALDAGLSDAVDGDNFVLRALMAERKKEESHAAPNR